MKGATLPRVLDIIQASVPDGAEPGAVFETIEHALRAEYANKIEST
jgi:regulator of RNase E activity RraB